MEELSPIEKLENIEKEIQKAKLESDVYKRQLEELKPMRKEIEDEVVEKYNRKIDELPTYKSELEKELEILVADLETKIEKAKKENPIE
jgi:DNA repair ATPase RecN